MPRNDTPKSKWYEQYSKEYRRISQAIRRQEKLGYFVPEEVRPIKPSKMPTIKKSDVQKLIRLTPKKIRKESVWIDTDSGEAFSGLDIVKSHHKAKPSTAKTRKTTSTKKRKQRKTKTPEPEPTAPPIENNLNMQIIQSINNLLEEWQPAPYWHASFLQRKTENYHKISTLWKETLENEGEYEVAYRLESNASEFIRLVERLLYSSDSTIEDDFNMGRFLEMLIGRPLTAFESDYYSEMAREAAMDSLRGENSIG